MQHDVMQVVRTAIEVGIISEQPEGMKMISFVMLMEGVRAAAFQECVKLCCGVADRHHAQMWEYKGSGLNGCADLEKARVDTAELIQRLIKARMQNEDRPSQEAQGRQGGQAQAGSASSPEARAVGAVRPEADAASPAAQAAAPVTGVEHG